MRPITLLAVLMIALAPIGAQAQSSDSQAPSRVTEAKPALPDVWRAVRQGEPGTVTGQPAARGVLIQSEGEAWRAARNGRLAVWSALAIALVTAAIGAFYVIRGKILMDTHSGRMVLRFKAVERAGHWLTAGSFLVLAFSGLNLMFGRWVLEPVIGKTLFAWLAWAGKWLHNICGFTFIAGLAMIFVLWARDNLWDRYDWGWIMGGGGLLKKGVHPPAAKFNFGQKTQFWMVVLVGAAVAYTGVNLLFPFTLADLHQLQLLQLAHAALAVVMVLFMLGHIYIGTIGMEGASSAMTTGYVDEEWAREHHSAWIGSTQQQPGE
ncbi:MAG: formate dehydrogenase subunit gamma [Actinomycetota bacterium]